MESRPSLLADMIKPAAQGDVVIKYFSPTPEDTVVTMLKQNAMVPPGRYVCMKIGDKVMMSDTPMEIRSSMQAITRGYGKMLIAGLGLGLVLHRLILLRKIANMQVTVVEINRHVIDLIGPYYQHPNIEIIHGDIFTFNPPEDDASYDCAWFDIWPDRSNSNMPQMKVLLRKFRKYVAGWMECWSRKELMFLEEKFQKWKRMKDGPLKIQMAYKFLYHQW